MEADKGTIGAVRLRDVSDPTPGSTFALCGGCKETVLVAPSSKKRIREGYVPYCQVCLPARLKAVGETMRIELERHSAADEATDAGAMEPN
jgi:hypothetical protein